MAPCTALFCLAQHPAQDSIEPGADAGGITELVEANPGAATRFLHRVLGVGPRVGTAGSEREQAVEVRKDERVEARVAFGDKS
jgi:hypothetical protein